MKRLLIVLLSLTTCALTLGCDKHDDKNPIRNISEATKDRDLQGKNFASGCSIQPLDAVLTGLFSGGTASVKSATTVYRFDGDNITRTTNLYTSADCSGETAIKFEEQGTFTLHTDQRTQDLGKFIDIDYNGLLVTAVTDEGIAAANAISLCGANDWAPNGDARDETAHAKDLTCYSAELPRHNANIYRVDANVLYFGTQTKASTDATDRPTNLDMNDKYTAQ